MIERSPFTRPEPIVKADTGISDDEDLIGLVGDAQTLLIVGYAAVNATCTKVETKAYRWGTRFLFTFKIRDNEKYEGKTLFMFARLNEQWKTKYIPESSKLYKCACVAEGYRLPRGFPLTKSMFLKKIFRCRLHHVGEGAAKYTTVEIITEKVG